MKACERNISGAPNLASRKPVYLRLCRVHKSQLCNLGRSSMVLLQVYLLKIYVSIKTYLNEQRRALYSTI